MPADAGAPDPLPQRIFLAGPGRPILDELLAVILEIKWSDHPEVATSLVEQLGRGYLLENGLTHGIYLVGWCGRGAWSGAGPKPEPRPEPWRERLEEQARVFQQEERHLKIVPFLLDLTWND